MFQGVNTPVLRFPVAPISSRRLADFLLFGITSAELALLVVQTDGGYAGMSDTVVELRVEDHELPIEDLRRIYTLHDEIFGTTPERFWLPVDDELAAELRERLAKLGYEGELEDSFIRWTGKENLEDRVDGFEKIDPVVLEALRNRT